MAVYPLSLLALIALGSPQAPGVGWVAPQECPTQGEVEASISALLLEPPDELEPWQGEVARVAEGYELTLEVGVRRRVVSAADCESLGVAAALIVAVAHDPVSVAAALDAPLQHPIAPAVESEPEDPAPFVPTDTEDVVEEEAEDEPLPSAARPTNPWPRQRSGLQGLARLSFGVEIGVLPDPGLGFELATGIRGEQWRVEVGAIGTVPRQVTAGDNDEFGATSTLIGAQARGCYDFTRPKLDVPLCGGLEAAGVIARGFGPDLTGRSQTQLWLAGLASGGVAWWARPRFGLAARAELVVGLRQPAVHIDGVGLVFRAGSVGARVWLGPVLRFP